MYVVPKVILTDEDDNKNWYGYQTGTMVFNNYKTKKNYGRFVLNVPKELDTVLKLYLKQHPLKGSAEPYPLLVQWNGNKLNDVNGIQNILYRIFKPKRIGSTMLRHIYLTDKYGDAKKEAEMDADVMGHSVAEAQKTYVK